MQNSLDFIEKQCKIVAMDRWQKKNILNDLTKKMVFIVGPRQVGKTWLANEIATSFQNTAYLNYDRLEDRKIIHDEAWLDSTELLILDEIHKMPEWKNYLKGVYDTKKEWLKIIVTGSARLDTFRQSGDSLSGRFFIHRLLPFSPRELLSTSYAQDLDRFITRGAFPEPFLFEHDTDSKRWRMQYIDGLIRTDILDFEKIHDFKAIQLVLELLRQRVGSSISYSSIAQDVGVSPNTVKKYIQIFEALYIVFRVIPFTKNIGRSLLKEPKIYFFDTGMVKGDIGVQFENMVGLCLLKAVYAKQDYLGESYSLRYIRTKDGREIDFCITKENTAEQFIEVKVNDSSISKQLAYFSLKYNIPGVQVVKQLKRERQTGNITVRKALSFLQGLYL